VGRAGAAIVPGVFNTGVTINNNTLAPLGSNDIHYMIVSAPAPFVTPFAPFVSNPPNAAWAANTATSQWISPTTSGNDFQPAGNFDYRTTFSLAGFNPASARISGAFAGDDQVTSILLNGIALVPPVLGPPNPGFGALTAFGPAMGAFAAGTNTLDIIVNNLNGPSGLQLQVQVTADPLVGPVGTVPEPASLLVFGLGNLAAGFYGWRRRRALATPAA
jgi:hypothetical protein